MKNLLNKFLFSFLLTALSILSAAAQYNTGDAQLNVSLSNIDANASLDFGAFKTDVSLNYNVSENKIDSWSVDLGMKAGDIYMAVELAKITNKPVDEVVKIYQQNKSKGWGVMAKQLGIKPGSPEFHALKSSLSGKGKKEKSGGKPAGKPGNGKKH